MEYRSKTINWTKSRKIKPAATKRVTTVHRRLGKRISNENHENENDDRDRTNRLSPIDNVHNDWIDTNPFRSSRNHDIDEQVISVVKVKTEAQSPNSSPNRSDGKETLKKRYNSESENESRSEETNSKRSKNDDNKDLGT